MTRSSIVATGLFDRLISSSSSSVSSFFFITLFFFSSPSILLARSWTAFFLPLVPPYGKAAVLIDPATVGYCNLPNTNTIPTLTKQQLAGYQLTQVRSFQTWTATILVTHVCPKHLSLQENQFVLGRSWSGEKVLPKKWSQLTSGPDLSSQTVITINTAGATAASHPLPGPSLPD